MESTNESEDYILIQVRCKLSNKVALGLLIRIRYRMGAEILSENLKEVIAQECFSPESSSYSVSIIGINSR